MLTLLAISGCVLALPAFSAVYEAPGIAIETSDEAPLGIVSIRASADGPALYTSPDTVETTWELLMVDADGNEFTVDPVSRNLGGEVSETSGALAMAWDAAEIPGGTVEVACAFARAPAMHCRRGEGTEAKRAYLQECVNVREAARDYLEFGYLQRPVQVLSEIPDVPIMDPKKRPSSIKAVLHSSWINEEGSLAFVFTNVSEQVQQIEWQADLTRYEIAPAEVYRIQRIMPDGARQSIAEIELPRIERTDRLQPHEIAIYEVSVGAY